LNAQTNEKPLRKTQEVHAPDGSLAMTITDDSRHATIKLISVINFYKYQLLDTETNEPVLTASNRGKECTLNKSKIMAGTYNLRLYTKNFIITSKIDIATSPWLKKSNNIVVAINN
jgi:hypothetical protein